MRDIWLEHMEDRCGCSDDGFEPEQEAEIAAKQVADDAALRVARNTTAGVKQVAAAFGIRL